MSHSYPNALANESFIRRRDTDGSLSREAKLTNNTRYMYFKKVAQGGKCNIQACKDLHLGRVVCYKSLRKEFADDPQEQLLFLREARVTAMLQHPNTAPVYEVGFDSQGHYYFTMKLVTGVTLREVLDGLSQKDPAIEATWDRERLIDVVIQVGQALSYAHVHGVVHCDIKPENIVAGAFGEVLLLDWGLAELLDRTDQDASDEANDVRSVPSSRPAHQGTPLYMSPEQISGDAIDHRTDIFSLGAVLFEILTFQQLAWGDSLDEMLRNTVNTPPPTPSIVAPDKNVPSALETLYFRCVQRAPERRIQTALEVIHELLYWLRTDARHRPM